MTKILVAEDERDIRELVGSSLRGFGFETVQACDGVMAVERARAEHPDLILMDVRMPRMTGYQACKKLKEMDETKDIPVVFLSAKAQESEIEKGLAAGAEEYLLKLIGPYELVDRIRAVLKRIDLGIYQGGLMRDSAEMQKDIDRLLGDVKQLRKERADLLRRLTERGSQSSTLAQQFPLAELSRLTDGIVHDMRSGLGIIRNTVGFMEDDLGDARQSDLLKISRSLDYCELVLRNLSALGGQDIFQPNWVNLEAIARDVYFMLERKLVSVELVVETEPNVPNILADEGQMKQVFMNLVKNAGEAMPDGGTLIFRAQCEGDMLRVELADTGCGISPENQARLFKEFFTTKERGYGLGLYIVHSIVKRHGGMIEVVSEIDKGTTFILRLPIESKQE